MSLFTVTLFALSLSSLSGCGGGGSKTTVNHRITTKGQELLDLQRARDSGAITDSEYEEQREQVLKNY